MGQTKRSKLCWFQREPAVLERSGAECSGRAGGRLAQHEESTPPVGERAAPSVCPQQAEQSRPHRGRRQTRDHSGRGETFWLSSFVAAHAGLSE